MAVNGNRTINKLNSKRIKHIRSNLIYVSGTGEQSFCEVFGNKMNFVCKIISVSQRFGNRMALKEKYKCRVTKPN